MLNKKENNLIECQEALKQEKLLNTNLTYKYDTLLTQYESEKVTNQLQYSQLNEKVIFVMSFFFTK